MGKKATESTATAQDSSVDSDSEGEDARMGDAHSDGSLSDDESDSGDEQ